MLSSHLKWTWDWQNKSSDFGRRAVAFIKPIIIIVMENKVWNLKLPYWSKLFSFNFNHFSILTYMKKHEVFLYIVSTKTISIKMILNNLNNWNTNIWISFTLAWYCANSEALLLTNCIPNCHIRKMKFF